MPEFKPFDIQRVEATRTASHEYVNELDKTIDELAAQLDLLQGVRRAVAASFGIDRRDGVGTFAQMADAAKRAEYEGDETRAPDGRLRPSPRMPRAVEAAS